METEVCFQRDRGRSKMFACQVQNPFKRSMIDDRSGPPLLLPFTVTKKRSQEGPQLPLYCPIPGDLRPQSRGGNRDFALLSTWISRLRGLQSNRSVHTHSRTCIQNVLPTSHISRIPLVAAPDTQTQNPRPRCTRYSL